MPTYVRSDQARIDVRVAGVTLDSESWDVLEGADRTADDLAIFPGGMKPQVQLGGIPKRSPAKVQRAWAATLIEAFKQLDEAVGNSEAEIVYTVLNSKGEKLEVPGNPITYKGIILKCERPNYKAGTAEEPYLTIEVGTNAALG